MRAPIVLFLVLVLLVTRIPTTNAHMDPPTSEPFQLQGDKLGESLTSFVSRHPKAQCEDATKTRKNCYQWADVSIFGFSAHPDLRCSATKHSLPGCVQGITAQFTDGRLHMLTYAVAGSDSVPAVATLKKEFGAPIMETPMATMWLAGNKTPSVVVGKATEQEGAETLITFMIQG